VSSPSYTIISEYAGRLPFYHIDAYRLQDEADFAALGGEEILYGQGVSVIEWSEHIPGSIPAEAVRVDLSMLPGTTRCIRVSFPGGFREPLL
jgi:tRNA threonylcarbamoyladenosine biosynthesis protein TsaE